MAVAIIAITIAFFAIAAFLVRCNKDSALTGDPPQGLTWPALFEGLAIFYWPVVYWGSAAAVFVSSRAASARIQSRNQRRARVLPPADFVAR
jgi:uncharacterized RDD family membrane protein YckC